MRFDRGAANRAVVIRTVDANQDYPGPTVLSTDDAGLGTQYGPQITLGRWDGECRGWEVTYFGLLGGGGRATAVGDNDLAIPGALGLASLDFFAADQMTVTTGGSLHSLEINRLGMLGDWTWLAGVRYLYLNDTLNIHSGDIDTAGSDYHLAAFNNLFGGQIGLRRSGRLGAFGWDISGKAGLYGNSASQNQFVTDFPNPNPPFYLRSPVHSSTGAASFVGEVNIGVSYALTDHLAVRAGYKLLWLEGVALSGNQLDFGFPGSTDATTDASGGVFLHGALAGVEWTW